MLPDAQLSKTNRGLPVLFVVVRSCSNDISQNCVDFTGTDFIVRGLEFWGGDKGLVFVFAFVVFIVDAIAQNTKENTLNSYCCDRVLFIFRRACGPSDEREQHHLREHRHPRHRRYIGRLCLLLCLDLFCVFWFVALECCCFACDVYLGAYEFNVAC